MQNCWEFKKCGKAGKDPETQCPATIETSAHKLNRGKNAGRMCWAVSGTLCNGEIQGAYAEKLLACADCDFRRKVEDEEGRSFQRIYFRDNESSPELVRIGVARRS